MAVRDEAPVPVRTSRYLAGAPGQPNADIEMLIYIIRGEVRGEAAIPGHSFRGSDAGKDPRGDNRSVLAARPNALAIGEGRSHPKAGSDSREKSNKARTNFVRGGCHAPGSGLRILQDGRFVIEAALFHFVGKRRGNVCACCAPHDRLSSSSWLSAPRLRARLRSLRFCFRQVLQVLEFDGGNLCHPSRGAASSIMPATSCSLKKRRRWPSGLHTLPAVRCWHLSLCSTAPDISLFVFRHLERLL